MQSSYRLTKYDKAKLHAIRSEILKDITIHHTIPEFSRKYEINEFKLKKGFKDLYGRTIYGFLEDERLKLAVRLLLSTDHSINDIALKCGYNFTTNFIATFRRKYNITPVDFRKTKRIVPATSCPTLACCIESSFQLYPFIMIRS